MRILRIRLQIPNTDYQVSGYVDIFLTKTLILFTNRVAYPDPGSRAFLTPESGMEKIQRQDPGSGMNIPDLISENSVSVFRVKNTYIL
jgi:hypothetical protein